MIRWRDACRERWSFDVVVDGEQRTVTIPAWLAATGLLVGIVAFHFVAAAAVWWFCDAMGLHVHFWILFVLANLIGFSRRKGGRT